MPSDPTTPAVASELAHLEVLVVDCQTTGATPERGHLLEIAWTRLPGTDADLPPIHTAFTALPDGARIPPRISALTGIQPSDVARAPRPSTVWRRLVRDAARVAQARRLAATPAVAPVVAPVLATAVAHYARFERSFFTHLHETSGRGPFPLDLLCTHEIACRLLPGLPRRGLKALAGRLGHVLGETKRAAAHVEATVCVWRELVARLEEDPGVRTLEDLRTWIDETTATRRGGRDYAVDRAMRLELSRAPGVYRMLGRNGEVLYLGKATSLRDRVNGYFQKRRHDRDRMPEMLTQAFDIDVTETETPLEAALLEADEIKRHAPPYNIQLRKPALCFANAALDDFADRADAAHDLGPFPNRRAADSLAALRSLIARPVGVEDVWRRALDLVEGATPDAQVLAAGLVLFCDRHRVPVHLGAAQVAGLGARLFKAWRAEQEAKKAAAAEAVPEDEATVPAEDDPSPREPWVPSTPEEAAAALEGVVLRYAWLVRRARWLVRLSESCLVWRPPHRAPGAARRHLVVERGAVVRAEDVPPGAHPVAPPGWPRGRARRLDSFDAATHDRLRVLSTELRRLVAAGKEVHLALDPRQVFDRDALGRRLFWV